MDELMWIFNSATFTFFLLGTFIMLRVLQKYFSLNSILNITRERNEKDSVYWCEGRSR